MPSIRKLPKLLKLLRPKNIWKCIKIIVKLYFAYYLVTDLILHAKRISKYSKPFTSAVVSYTNNYAEHAKLSRSLSPSDEKAEVARTKIAQIRAYKKLLPFAEEDMAFAKNNNLIVPMSNEAQCLKILQKVSFYKIASAQSEPHTFQLGTESQLFVYMYNPCLFIFSEPYFSCLFIFSNQ